MPLLETFALNIGAAVAKFLIETYWGKNAATTAAGKAFEVAASQILSRKPKDKSIEDVASQIASRLSELLKAERISDEDRERLALEIALTLDEAKITSKLLVECNLDYAKLLPHLETSRPDATKLLSDSDTAIYNRMLREACEAILSLAVTMAGLDRHYKAATLQDLDQLKYLFAKLLEREDERATLFEKRYRADVETVLDWMDIFGAPKAKEFERRLSLTTIYLTLEAEWEEERERNDARRFLNVVVRDDEGEKRIERYVGSVDKLLEKNRRLVIEGNAGSGKTTLLRWLAVKTAKKELPPSLADWNETTPFYIPLREYVNKTPPFPNIEDFIRLDTSGKPETWVRDRLERGRALVLIDGVDEMPNEQREAMWERISRLVKQFPFAYYVISSRPYALRSEENKSWLDWFAQEDFVLASLKPMTHDKVETFVRYWHEALKKFARSEHEREVISRNTTNLIATFNRNLPLRQLAETPLLCAMICSMHQSVDQKVPSNRIDLYQTCIDMMLSKRDDARDIDSLVKLDPRQKWDLAKGFAYKLMLNDLSDIEIEEAQNYFAKRLSEMRLNEPADKVLRDFIDRANLLRGCFEIQS